MAVIALLSIFLFAGIFSSPDTYQGINSTLDEKKNNVMTLAASTTAASAAISLLPGDTGSGIANKLVDLTSYFLVILAVIYLEKFLLTTFGFVAFAFMIPASCALFAIALFSRSGTRLKANLQQIGAKVLALAIALLLVTSCLVPLLVLALFLWFIKVITGIDYGGVSGALGKARMTGRSVASSFKSDGKPKKLE